MYADARVKEEFKRYEFNEYDIEVIAELIDHSDVDESNYTTLFDPKQEFLKEVSINKAAIWVISQVTVVYNCTKKRSSTFTVSETATSGIITQNCTLYACQAINFYIACGNLRVVMYS